VVLEFLFLFEDGFKKPSAFYEGPHRSV